MPGRIERGVPWNVYVLGYAVNLFLSYSCI